MSSLNLKDITESIKLAKSGQSTPAIPVENEPVPVEQKDVEPQNHTDEKEERPIKKKKKADLAQRIFEYNNQYREELRKEENGGVFFIRLTEKERRKLNLLSSVKLSNQAIGAFLVNEFLENAETKRIIKEITDDLD